MYQIVCCVKQIIRKYNESHKLCSYKLTLLSLICDTHEMNIQRQTSVISNFLYIEVFTQVPWTSIYPSFTVYHFTYTQTSTHFISKISRCDHKSKHVCFLQKLKPNSPSTWPRPCPPCQTRQSPIATHALP